MENSIQPGDQMVVATGSGVRRGDIVILSVPPRPSSQFPAGGLFVRRVIGLPGDRVACCSAGRVTVDGKPLDESYVYPGDQPSAQRFSVVLGRGQLWVLGDRRSIAIDSRMWGPVPVADVVGRVAVIERGDSVHLLRTPQAFVAAGLAPADGRTPSFLWPLIVGSAAMLTLLVLVVLGVIRALLRRRRHRPATAAR